VSGRPDSNAEDPTVCLLDLMTSQKGPIDSQEHQHLRISRISFQQHESNHTPGVPLVHVVPTPRAGVHDRSETHVVAVDKRPQPFALLT
jgi:hypothetical protein